VEDQSGSCGTTSTSHNAICYRNGNAGVDRTQSMSTLNDLRPL
jgi:hypothetical protein